MSKRRKVPEDLMATILGERSGSFSDERTSSRSTGSRRADRSTAASASTDESTISWEKQPERVGTTFNLSKQVNGELDKLRLELQLEEGIRSSNSEITELALLIAIEDARVRGRNSELVKRLSGRPTDRVEEDTGAAHGTLGGTSDEVGWTTRRSVDDSGRIFETTYSPNGEIAGEEAVGDVADLPVEAEYLDEEGRFRSLANDELGNTFEWVVDNEFNTIRARLVRGTERLTDRVEEDTGAAHGTLGGTSDEVGWTTRRSVDDSGRIFETTYSPNGEIAGEEAVGDVADLPVEAEYLDEEGRFRSLANDELGNTFEWVVDNEFNTIRARLVRGTD